MNYRSTSVLESFLTEKINGNGHRLSQIDIYRPLRSAICSPIRTQIFKDSTMKCMKHMEYQKKKRKRFYHKAHEAIEETKEIKFTFKKTSCSSLCPMPFALCPMPFALCPSLPFHLFPLPYALCPMPFAHVPTFHPFRPALQAYDENTKNFWRNGSSKVTPLLAKFQFRESTYRD